MQLVPGNTLVQLLHLRVLEHFVEIGCPTRTITEVWPRRSRSWTGAESPRGPRIQPLRLVNRDDGVRVQRDQRREKLLQRRDELVPRTSDIGPGPERRRCR